MSELLDKAKRKIAALNRKAISKESEQIIIWVKSDKLNAESLVKKYNEAVKPLNGKVEFSCQKPAIKEITGYCYEPECAPMDELQMAQVAYCLLHVRYDFIVVSKSLAEYPNIAADKFEDVFVYWSGYKKSELLQPRDGISRCGRLLRLAGKNHVETIIDLKEIMPDYRFEDEFRLKYAADDKPIYRAVSTVNKQNGKSDKPVVFVLPIFMAVGGVERNTIETMRSLQDKYSFVVITMERHMQAQGSLHDQLYGLCDAIYDIRELFEFADYLNVLEDLKQIYNPDVVWLCNNSPWLEANSLAFRKVFDDAAIIAQDVYDTKYGWIEYYHDTGIQSFDRFIAINQKIKEAFINEYNINESKIDVIYPVVDDKKIRNEKSQDKSRETICAKYGLDSEKKHFAYVGRLTEQKDPVRFVRLAANAIRKYPDMEWVIVGDGHLKDAVEEAIRSEDMVGKIIPIPYVQNVPELYRVIDGLIMVSIYEGMPIVSIEAMSMGVPVFGTDVGDLRLFVEKYELGKIIPIDNTDDMGEFEKWLGDYEVYKSNAVKHSTEILDFFSANELAKKYIYSFEQGCKKEK